jgi:predicted DNA-binding transcriptional regulator AlpA
MTKKVQRGSEPALGVSIPEAASMVGMGESLFYDTFIDTGRLRPVSVGRRRIIPVSELRAAFDTYVADLRAIEMADAGCGTD